MKNIILILLSPLFVCSQQVLVSPLSQQINTDNAELNFIQVNDTTGYFTVANEVDGKLESDIYMATFSNGIWSQKKYSIYNFDFLNTSNISFFNDSIVLFSICNEDMQSCKIAYIKKNTEKKFKEISNLSSDIFLNTQAFIAAHLGKNVLYFVSDRNGGFGGLDIWISIIDEEGNFGVPINAGKKINSSADEITPFYNYHNGMIYFSSNKKTGMGGFDIYKAKGSLNLWDNPKNVEELNSEKDDLYLVFYDENTGYLSSNRKGSQFKNTEYCCNDIFSFKYETPIIDTASSQLEVKGLLPLSLYFHNDEPDRLTMSDTTVKTYKDSYISYFMIKSDYEKINKKSNVFFESILQKNFNTLNNLLERLLSNLSKGKKVELQIRGYSSPLHTYTYNQNLSKRRIISLINYIKQFKNGSFKKHIFSRNLIIKELSFGEEKSPKTVSDDAKNKKESIYSIEAMLERKIEIIDVILKE